MQTPGAVRFDHCRCEAGGLSSGSCDSSYEKPYVSRKFTIVSEDGGIDYVGLFKKYVALYVLATARFCHIVMMLVVIVQINSLIRHRCLVTLQSPRAIKFKITPANAGYNV
jgi:hypothetical protein